jgi:hypothetical protein
VGRADTPITAIVKARKVDAIKHVIPGRSPVGGQELFDEGIQRLWTYCEVAKQGVRFTEMAKAMMEWYPKHGVSLLRRSSGIHCARWWTRRVFRIERSPSAVSELLRHGTSRRLRRRL